MSRKARPGFILSEMADRSEVLISYSALPDEVDPKQIPFFKKYRGITFSIPNTDFPDPLKYAAALKKRCASQKVYLVIPGRRFDIFGTRRGRGRGWFDRLLSRLPPGWVRIGVVKQKNLSRSPLPRQPHDEPVDWIICRTAGGRWRVFETGARRK